MPPSNQAVILERLESLKCDVIEFGRSLKEEVGSINASLKDVGKSLSDFKLEYEKRHGELVKQTDANTKEILRLDKEHNELDVKVDTLVDEVNSLKNSVSKLLSAMKWALGIFTSVFITILISFLGFLWAILTHQIAIISIAGTPIP